MNPIKKKIRKQRFGADGMAVVPNGSEEPPMDIDNHPAVDPVATEAAVEEVGFAYEETAANTMQEPVAFVEPTLTIPLAPGLAESPELSAVRIAAAAKELLEGGSITQKQYQTVTGSGLGGMKRKSIYMKGDKLMCDYDNKTVTTIAPDGTERATTWTILGVTWAKLYWVAAFVGVALLLAVLVIWANKK